MFPVLCAWCSRVLYFAEVEGSHGICGACRERLLATHIAGIERWRDAKVAELEARHFSWEEAR